MASTFAQRIVASLTVAAVLAGAAAAVPWHGARTAHACSIVTPHDAFMARTVEQSPIVAIGHWEDSQERAATFVVEQPLKGAQAGDRLRVDNRTTYTAMACSPYDEPFREGYRFLPGERAVLLLEKEVDGLWQVSHLSLAVFEVPHSLDAPMDGVGWYFGDPEAGTPTDVKLRTIVEAAGYGGGVALSGGESPAPGRLPPGPGWSPFPGPAAARADDAPVDGLEWLGLALGAGLFVLPVAWRWRAVSRGRLPR